MGERERFDRLTDEIIGSAIEVHRSLGPGLLESAYETCLAYELGQRGINVERQKSLPVMYREVKLEVGYRLDLLVEGPVIVEVKAVERLLPIHGRRPHIVPQALRLQPALRNILKKANALFPPTRPQGSWLLGAHPPDPLPEGSLPLDSLHGLLR